MAMPVIDRAIDALGGTRRGLLAFAGLGVAEGSFLPVPVEPVVLPVMAYRPHRAWLMAAALLAGCLVGCLALYAVGRAAGAALVDPILATFGLTEAFDARIDAIRDNAFVTLFLIGLTPVPLQVGTLGAGVAAVNPVVFLAAMATSRGLRYGAVALAAVLIGARARTLFERHRGALVVGSMAVLALAVAAFQLVGA